MLAPTQTVVTLEYNGFVPAPDLDIRKDIGGLKTPDGQLPARGSSGAGTGKAGDKWKYTYNLEFQRLDSVPPFVSLELAGRIYLKGETNIPLDSNKSVIAADGREIMVKQTNIYGAKGTGIIEFSIDHLNPFPYDNAEWRILDNKGELHETRPINNSNTGTITEQELAWTLPTGRKPVALVNPGYWKFEENLGNIEIQIPKK